ncbi:MAG: hypothetical protein NT098_05745 [Candidatus Parcubacteria bacterium]|nr:hypothetical protein [Candidatus Parcubacteria bacterium]
MPPETENNKIVEEETVDSEVVQTVETPVEMAPIEAGAVAPAGEVPQTVIEPVVVVEETPPVDGVIPAEPILMPTETVVVPDNVDSGSEAGMTEGLSGDVPPISEIQNNVPVVPVVPVVTADVVAPPVITSAPIVENKWSFLVGLFAKAREKLQFRKRKKLDRILAEVTKKGKITNNEVEKLLRISDKTADRYLSQLIKEGKIKTNGLKGRALFYLAV